MTLSLDAMSFLKGGWTTISRVGKYPQIDFTRTRADQAAANYDPVGIEVATINLDHTPKGPSLGQIAAARMLGDLFQIRTDPSTVTQELRDAVTGPTPGAPGKYFRPSGEFYPSFSHANGECYLKGLGLMGNGAVQVRGLPRIVEFATTGERIACLADDEGGEGYVCLDNADREEISVMDKDQIAKLQADKDEADRKMKDALDKVAALEAKSAQSAKEAKAKEDEVAMLSGRLKAIEESAAKERVKAREKQNSSALEALKKDRKISPAEMPGYLALLNALPVGDDAVIKLGDGEKAETVSLSDGLLKLLDLRKPILQFGDKMPSSTVETAANLEEAEAEAVRLTEEAITSNKVKRGPEAQAFYLENAKRLSAPFQRN